MRIGSVGEDGLKLNHNDIEKRKGKSSSNWISMIREEDIGKTVSVKLHYHRTIMGILSDISKAELEITAKRLWKKVRIIVLKRYVVSVEFPEEAGER
jgi:hypothetical protein